MSSVLGYVMAKDEWPLVGISIVHALSLGIDEVVVLDHASDDETGRGIDALRTEWPGRLDVLRLDDDRFLQEATTAVVAALVEDRGHDWVYVFDADEFMLIRPGLTLKEVLAHIPQEIDAARYCLDQWVAPTDFDDRAWGNYSRIEKRAVPKVFTGKPGELLAAEVERASLNYFDVPFGSKVIVRSGVFHALAPGAHELKTPIKTTEVKIDPSDLKVGHLPFLSRRRLDLKCRQGRSLIDAGFGGAHGWQSQMLSRMDAAGELERFWLDHSVRPVANSEPVRSEPMTEDDQTLALALEAAVASVKSSVRSHAPSDQLKSAPRTVDRSIDLSTAIGAVHRQQTDRDVAARQRDGLVAERDGLVAERDGLVAERDGLVAERDAAVADRDIAFERAAVVEGSKSWRWTAWLRKSRAKIPGS